MKAVRQRDARGRFIKKDAPQQPVNSHQVDENDREHQVMQAYNRIADGGEPVTEESLYRRELWMKRTLHALFVVFILFLAFLLVGCKTKRVVEYRTVEKKVTETVTVVDTLIEVQLVPYKETVSVPDSTSHLENPYAYSDAFLRDGVLHHSLGIKPQNPLFFPAQMKFMHIHDSIPYPVPGPTQYVERSYNTIEKILMGAGLLSIGGAVVLVISKVKKFV